MRLTESTLRRIVREEIVNAGIKSGTISLREGRRILREGENKQMNAGKVLDAIEKIDPDLHSRLDRQMGRTSKDRAQNVELEPRPDQGVVKLYWAGTSNFIDDIPMDVSKKLGA